MSTRASGPKQTAEGERLAGEPAWPVALLFPPQGQWTEEDYLSLSTNLLVELSAGVLEVPETRTDRHLFGRETPRSDASRRE